MSNKHEINSYDRAFLKALNYGELMPMVVIKNYDDEIKADFEMQLEMLLSSKAGEFFDFGSVKFGEDEYYIAGCYDEAILKNMISQGYNTRQVVTENFEPLVCGIFDFDKNINEPGVAPFLSYQTRENADADKLRSLTHKLASSQTKADDFMIYVTTDGDKEVIKMCQTGVGKLLAFQPRARALALNILREYRDVVKNVQAVDIDGRTHICNVKAASFRVAEKNKDIIGQTYEQTNSVDDYRAKYELNDTDISEIMDNDYGSNRVVASVIKNPELSYQNLRRICSETKGAVDSDCEIVSMLGQNGDKFVLFVVDKDMAATFLHDNVKIAQKLLRSSGKSYSIQMQNIDNLGRVVPVEKRLIGRFETGSKSKVEALQTRLESDELCAKVKPEVVKFDKNSYGVYINNLPLKINRRGRTDSVVHKVREVVSESDIRCVFTDAYGEPLPQSSHKKSRSKTSACAEQKSADLGAAQTRE